MRYSSEETGTLLIILVLASFLAGMSLAASEGVEDYAAAGHPLPVAGARLPTPINMSEHSYLII